MWCVRKTDGAVRPRPTRQAGGVVAVRKREDWELHICAKSREKLLGDRKKQEPWIGSAQLPLW